MSDLLSGLDVTDATADEAKVSRTREPKPVDKGVLDLLKATVNAEVPKRIPVADENFSKTLRNAVIRAAESAGLGYRYTAPKSFPGVALVKGAPKREYKIDPSVLAERSKKSAATRAAKKAQAAAPKPTPPKKG